MNEEIIFDPMILRKINVKQSDIFSFSFFILDNN
jgi:hypothetical protein